jgi:ubiquinone/menaquinone biosynthesis C-methylase UbiE
MERIPEAELMDDPEQALAYSKADFSVAHGARVQIFQTLYPQFNLSAPALDLGCGSGDVLLRFARAYPAGRFYGLDGSQPMLELAQSAIDAEPALRSRVELLFGIIPEGPIPDRPWQLIMSHSLLHQLHKPEVLWRTIKEHGAKGCAVFVADLRRPPSEVEARRVVSVTSKDEPEILQRDFYNSLCAAFEPDEVRRQLAQAGLPQLEVKMHDPFHLTVHGYL